ncbi:nucleotidyltransferase domain-containing protein [Collimonas pratensis]|uniref:Nucleotidyltransferase domain protein n=1 Tax=Collimonas pratensis TaxID=279113 RepID=A0ABM5Z4C1_9BURK|nr:nucleotidyltransferase domain-containing protein [Collimonas pratensis]AMP13563.1 nucleotidyltransferase domain protein [Collimonas pratensis]
MSKQGGVDELGYILTIGDQPLQPEFQVLVADVLAALTVQLAHLIHSIYLYGSVARGDAVASRSDLDLTLVLHRAASLDESWQLASIRSALQAAHPEVVKIDFDVGTLADITAADNLNSWGYWLKHHCRCIWGSDLATRFDLFKPSKAIALAVNRDLYEALDGYVERIEAASNRKEIQQLKRAAARKLIRATNVLRSDDDLSWPQSLDNYADLFLSRYPAMADSINYFLSAANAAHDTSKDFVPRLRLFMNWLRMQD